MPTRHPTTPFPPPVRRARRLTDEQRSAVASYFAVYKGQEKGVARLALAADDHPAVARAYELLREAFETVSAAGRRCCLGQGGGRASGQRACCVLLRCTASVPHAADASCCGTRQPGTTPSRVTAMLCNTATHSGLQA
jgi:hypothetical protein